MADIRINDLPLEGSPTPSEFLAIDGASTRKATIQNVVNSGAPVASQAQAEAGVDNNTRMTPLATKQAIDFNSVPISRTVTAGSGLTGGGPLSSNISLALSSTSLASLALADTSVQPSRQVIAGTGLSGGGALSSNVTLSLSSATQTSLGLADTAIQDGSNALIPNGGTTGQVLIKNSSTNRDTSWSTIAAATAVSYAAQTLNASQQAQARANISSALKGHIFGLTLSNNATDAVNDIDISTGECASTETNPVLMVLPSVITKRLDAAWAVGSGNGGLDTGSIANTTYHVWIIQRSDTGVVDALFSTSATSPTMPTNYDRKRRIGSIIRSSGSIIPFKQNADKFMWLSGIADVSVNNPGSSAVTRTLTVPTGISVDAVLQLQFFINAASTLGTYFYVSDLSLTDATPSVTSHSLACSLTGVISDGTAHVRTNTSGQVRSRVDASGTTVNIAISTMGFVDDRGRSS